MGEITTLETNTKETAESMVIEIQEKINTAFNIFDDNMNNTVDVREIGTIIRSLGCCPSEEDLHDILAEIEEEEPTGFISYERFLPMMTRVMMERKYRPATEDQLLKAFQVLDTDNKGFLTQAIITKAMTEEGEPFSHEEIEEFLSAAKDPDRDAILYKDFVSMMAIEDS